MLQRSCSLTMSKETGRRLTGKELLTRMQRFFTGHEALKASLKVTSEHGTHAAVHVVRCMLLETFLDELENEAILADIKNNHNMIGLFLHEALDAGIPAAINQRGESGIEIDIILHQKRCEIKTGRDLCAIDVPEFIDYYYADMVDMQGEKEAWWLVYFVQRSDAKDKIGELCLYYMTAIEITTRDIEEHDRNAIMKEATTLIQKVEKRVRKEDDMDAAVLLPVDNIVPIDRLRKKLKQRDKTIADKDKEIADKDKEIADKDKEIADLNKRLTMK
jgi:hypothetical protein